MMEAFNHKASPDCERETKMSRIRSELDQANKRADHMLTRLETIAIGLLGNEMGTITATSSSDGFGTKATLDPGSLAGLINRLSELHGTMAKIERQIERISEEL